MQLRTLSIALGLLVLPAAAGAGPETAAGPRPPSPTIFNPPGAPSQPAPPRSVGAPFIPAVPRAGASVAHVDLPALRAAIGAVGAVTIERFPLDAGQFVDLEAERFWVTAPDARFVAGGDKGDTPLDFDPGRVLLLRGRVRGHARSHVFLALSEWSSNGLVDLGPGLPTYGVSSRAMDGSPNAAGDLTVFRGAPGRGRNPVPYCEVLAPPGGDGGGGGDSPVRGLRQLQMAIETDHEFFQLFGDAAAATAYLLEVYGAVSDIYMDNILVRIDLTYTRVWPQPNEPFDAGLDPFRAYWLQNMQSVPRDTAQMFSGRADLPGGVAYLRSICNNSAFGFCGNAVGYFVDPGHADVFNYDPQVTAHELGHNCGSEHTDVYGLDNCNAVASTPQRGTIMSYCNQTISGGMGNIDMSFHVVTQAAMRDYTYGRSCVARDCNQNGVSDAVDIASHTSADANANGIPDECEDCNQNGVLDSIDIGTVSFDLNADGIPDECEPDCNGNHIPDDRDILLGTSQDLHGDGVPDECDADRNTNGVSDYHEIWSDMTLDKDRDVLLDSTQDCDQDGTPDLTALEGAGDVFAVSGADDVVKEYHSVTGTLVRTGAASPLSGGQDLIVTPDRRVLVSSANTNSVLEFDRLGAFVRTLVAPGSGGLSYPTGLARTNAGTLLVASRGTDAVLEFDLASGVFSRALVSGGAGGLSAPTALLVTTGGTLLVAGNDNAVREFDLSTGSLIRTLVAAGSGGLTAPRGMALSPFEGRLLVTSFGTDEVLEYDPGTGAFIRSLLLTGLHIEGPWCVRAGPDGMVYISRYSDFTDTHFTRAKIFIHDPRLGNFVRAHVQALDAALNNPTGFDFMPGDTTDCNRNLIPDSCDIARGTSLDANLNGVPDECEPPPCYANCDGSATPPVLNVLDFNCFLNRFAGGEPYGNCDGSTTPPVFNVLDFNCFLNRFAAGCP
jgi:DNA-binding beta-propeller fold protein YncE